MPSPAVTLGLYRLLADANIDAILGGVDLQAVIFSSPWESVDPFPLVPARLRQDALPVYSSLRKILRQN